MKKKSLLVVPALGVLLLAAAGSVGGTVAWFSSVSSVETTINTFQATRLDGNLSVLYGKNENRGTDYRVADDNTSGIIIKSGAKMTHASFDHATSTPVNHPVSTISSETDSHLRKVGDFDSSSTEWKAKTIGTGVGAYDVYYAVYWEMTFTYEFALEEKADLFLDPASVVNITTTAPEYSASQDYAIGAVIKKDGVIYKCVRAIPEGGHAWDDDDWAATEDTDKGFRIAFLGSTSSGTSEAATRVWAPGRPTSGANTPKYISNEDINGGNDQSTYTNATAYAANVLIGSGFNKDVAGTKIGEGEVVESHAYDDSHKYMQGYLGTFSNSAGTGSASITFKCVAWFEGTDAAISSSTLNENMGTITAAMAFYTRENKVGA